MGSEKVKYYRGDIWRADLKSVGIDEEHYVVLVNEWKSLRRRGNVNILVISSQEKDFNKTHVELSPIEYNLEKKSFILVESIFTISKSKLLSKVGKLDGTKMLEVDNKLKNNLQLDGKYNFLKDIDLESLFLENNVEIIREKEDLIKMKCEVHDLYENKKQYETAIIRGYELIEKTNRGNQVNKNDFLYYAYHIQALSYIKIKEFEKALECAKTSLTYIARPNEFNRAYSFVLWSVARASEETGRADKASEIYESLSKYYKTNNYEMLSIACRFNIYKINKSLEDMKEVKKELESVKALDRNPFTNEVYKQELLDEMCRDINILERS